MFQRVLVFCSLLLAALAGQALPAAAADYYVSTTGNDANAGTLAAPWRTVAKGTATAVAGDTIYLRGGVYAESQIGFANSGTPGNPITLTNYPGEHAVVDGERTSPPTFFATVFFINGSNYITFKGGSTGSLHIKRGSPANVYLGEIWPTIGISFINVEFSGLAPGDNSAYIYLGIAGVGGIAANGDPPEARTLIQDCHFAGDTTYPDPSGKTSDAAVISFSRAGDIIIRNNRFVGGHFGYYAKHGSTNNSSILIQGNEFIGQESFGIHLNRNKAVIRDNLIVVPQDPEPNTGTWGIVVYGDSSTCDATPAADNQILHNTIIVPNGTFSATGPSSKACDAALRTIVRDNVLIGYYTRVAWIWPYQEDLSSTTITNNIIYNPTAPTSNMIQTGSPSNSTISPNILLAPVFVNDQGDYFSDAALNDYTLAAESPGKNDASDGTDVGADMTIVGRYAGSVGGNQRPTVNASASPSNPIPGQTVTLTATAFDSDGTIASYSWDLGDGATATGSTVSHAYATTGTYQARVTVTDDGGATATATATVTVTSSGGGNAPPTVSVSADATSVSTNTTVTFTATATDADGTIASYAWDFGDGSTTTGSATATHAYASAGTFTTTVTVTDDGGATATATVSVSVTAGPAAPTVSVIASPATVLVGQTVTLTATASDSDGTISSYVWTLGDGASTSGVSVTHIYTAVGTYLPQVTVTDNDGLTATAGTVVNVGDGSLPANECANWQIDHPDWIWCDDFEDALTLSQKYGGNGLNIGANPNTMTRTTVASASGATSLRMRWNAGEINAGDFRRNFGRVPYTASANDTGVGPYFNEDFTEIYYRFATMHPTDFVGWPDKSSRAFSVATDVGNQWGPQAMVAHIWAATPGSSFLQIDPASGVDTSGTLLTTQWNDFGNFRWLGLQDLTVPYLKGQWHSVEVHVKLNTVGLADGVHEVWIDDQLAVSRTNIDWTSTWRDFGINGVQIESFWGAGSSVEQERYFDAFVISRSRIGAVAAAGNQPPTVSASASPASALTGDTITFTATASDADGTIAGTVWTFGDGATGSGANVTHAYSAAGTYTSVVTVTDNDGATTSASISVTISAPSGNQPPTVSASASPTSAFTGDAITFTATASDADGTIATYAWTFGDGTSGTGAGATHAYTTAGTYTATVTVTDNDGATATSSVTVSIATASNPVPSAPASITVPATDDDGTYVVSWTASTGAAWYDLYEARLADFSDEVFISVGNATQTTLTGRAEGTYYYRVGACNSSDACSTNTAAANPVVVNLPNVAPTATLSATPTSALTGASITFTAGGTDTDGTITSAVLNFGDGTSQSLTGSSASHAYAAAGSYTATVTVTDNEGATATASVALTIASRPPTVSVSAVPTTARAGDAIQFTASATDPDGTIAGYQWAFGDGQTAATGTGTVGHTYATAGTFTATVTVTDSDGLTASAAVTVTITPGNQPPAVSATATPTSADVGQDVQFTATATDDGAVASYAWSFGDGASATTATATHAYAAEGTFTASVTVTDNEGATTTAGMTITVVNIGASSVTLSAAPASPQPAGTVVTFTAQGSGSTGPYEYQFWRRLASGGTWKVTQSYATGNTWTWDTTGFAGSYVVVAYVREVGSSVGYEAAISLPFDVVDSSPPPPAPATSVTLTESLASPQASGVSVTFTAQAAGGAGPYEYQFWRRLESGGSWETVQPYSATSTWTWDTTGFGGTYSLVVYARTVGSIETIEAWTSLGYTLTQDSTSTPATGVTLTFDPATPVGGTAVNVTATATGGTGPYDYQFWRRLVSGGSWEMVQGYAAADTWAWDTTGDEGDWIVVVYVRTSGATGDPDVVTSAQITVLSADDPAPPPAVSVS